MLVTLTPRTETNDLDPKIYMLDDLDPKIDTHDDLDPKIDTLMT